MERSLLIGSLVAALAVLVCAAALWLGARRHNAPGPLRGLAPYVGAALAVLVAGFLATMPSQPPFAAGQGLGKGFLLGGLGALVALFVALSPDDTAEQASRTAAAPLQVAGVLAAGLCVSTLPLILLRSTLLDSLLGVSIGWLVAATICAAALYSAGRNVPGDPARPMPDADAAASLPDARRTADLLIGGLAFVVTLCATGALGELRKPVLYGSPPVPVSLSAIAAGLAAAGIFGLALGAVVMAALARTDADRAARIQPWVTPVTACGALLLVDRLLARQLLHTEPIWRLGLLGMAAAALAWWATAAEGDAGAPAWQPIWMRGGLAAVLWVCALMTAFQWLAGTGLGIALIAAWAVIAAAMARPCPHASSPLPNLGEGPGVRAGGEGLDDRPALVRQMLYCTILLLFRLFSARFDMEVRGVELTDHYALLGILLGALVPGYVAGALRSQWERGAWPSSRVAALAAAGAATLALPAAVVILWNTRCCLALLLGLAVGAALGAEDRRQNTGDRVQETADGVAAGMSWLPAVLALASALALAQWTGHVTPLAEMTRAQKAHLLEWIAGGLIAVLLAADYGGRLRAHRETVRAARVGIRLEGDRG